jgi:hypothetical protein
MSRQINNKNTKQATTQKKFCKVCFDAGKSEAEYSNHFVRETPEPSSKVVCPTLLQASCGYCHEKGHTPKCCKLLKAHQKEKQRQEYAAKKSEEAAKPEKQAKKKPLNVFAALMDSSDDEEEKTQVKQVNKKINSVQKMPAEKEKEKEPYNCAFPALPSTSTSSATSAKPAAKSQLATTLKQMCPGLEVGAKMPEVNTYRPPVAQLVRRPRKLTPEEEEDQFINNYIANQLKTDPKYQKQNKQLTKGLTAAAKYHESQSHYGEEDLLYEQASMCKSSGYDVSKLYEEAAQAYKISKFASNIDWTATNDSDSDDEDW